MHNWCICMYIYTYICFCIVFRVVYRLVVFEKVCKLFCFLGCLFHGGWGYFVYSGRLRETEQNPFPLLCRVPLRGFQKALAKNIALATYCGKATLTAMDQRSGEYSM